MLRSDLINSLYLASGVKKKVKDSRRVFRVRVTTHNWNKEGGFKYVNFDFPDDDLARRVAGAFQHAAALCGAKGAFQTHPQTEVAKSQNGANSPASATRAAGTNDAIDQPKPPKVAIGILFDQHPATNSGGLVITRLLEGGPADQSGLRKGDTILSLDGEPVSTGEDFQRLMASRRPGSRVSIKFRRDNSGLASRDGNGTKRGIRVARSDGFWAEMSLHTGDTILEVNKVKVSSEQQFRTFLSSLSQGRDVVL